MSGGAKKKTWKEIQRERQIKQKQYEEGHHNQKDQNKSLRKLPKGKIIFGICLIALLLVAYGTWQYYEGQKPPTIGGTANAAVAPTNSPSANSAPDFSLSDINGTQVSLRQFSGKVIGIHFMAVGCHGQINPINEYQLTQVKGACSSFCSKEEATFFTVAVATCQSSDLDVLRKNYPVSWTLGNDYDDKTLQIVNSYMPYEIGDGTVVLIDKNFNIAQVYSGGVSSETLISRMSQLTEA